MVAFILKADPRKKKAELALGQVQQGGMRCKSATWRRAIASHKSDIRNETSPIK